MSFYHGLSDRLEALSRKKTDGQGALTQLELSPRASVAQLAAPVSCFLFFKPKEAQSGEEPL